MNKWISKFLIHEYIPQYEYVYNKNHEKMIDHVLKFENLNDEFNALMETYRYPLRLDHNFSNASSSDALLTAKNLTSKTIKYIKTDLKEDFFVFGYNL